MAMMREAAVMVWEVERELGELQAVAAMVAGAMVVARATASMATTLMGGTTPHHSRCSC